MLGPGGNSGIEMDSNIETFYSTLASIVITLFSISSVALLYFGNQNRNIARAAMSDANMAYFGMKEASKTISATTTINSDARKRLIDKLPIKKLSDLDEIGSDLEEFFAKNIMRVQN